MITNYPTCLDEGEETCQCSFCGTTQTRRVPAKGHTFENWTNPLLRFIHWNGRNEAWLNVKDTLGHAMWNGIIFKNDPDVVFIRKENCTLTDEQKYLIAGVGELFGSQFMYSDDPGKAGESERIMTEKILSFTEKYKNSVVGGLTTT